MTIPFPKPEAAEDLLEQVSRASGLQEALGCVLDTVLPPRGVGRAAAFVFFRDELCGYAGMGWDAASVRRVALPADGDHPLVEAIRSGGTVVRVQASEPVLEMDQYVVLPLSGGVRPRFGAVVLPPSAREDQLAEVERELARIGPVLSLVHEVEASRQSTRQLEHQRELLTTIVNSLPDPVLITDRENSVLLENRRAEALFSSQEGDSEGRRRAVEINNLLFSSFLTRSTLGGPDGLARELNLVDPVEGGDLLFEVLINPLPPPLCGEGAMASVLRDVTDLKRATTELEHQFKRVRQAELKSRRERDRLNLILENVGDPILVTDDQSNIILMNREAERLFEVPAGTELDSRRRQDVRANDTKFSSFISDFSLSPDGTRVAEFLLSDPEQVREFPAEVVSGKILNDRGEMTAIVSVLHDLTKVVENKRLAAELVELNEGLEDRVREATLELEERNRQLEWQSRELERAYRLKSQFLASMSHELRTPINALLGYTSLMRDRIYGDLTTRQDEALDRMYAASQHLLELVNDILDLAKIEAGKMPVHIERVDVVHLVGELSQTIEPMIRRKQLTFEVVLEPDIPVLDTDRTKIKQVLLNLLSNAVKFTHEGKIEVRARAVESGGVEVAVSDTGIGIKDDDVAKIFEDFRQVDQSSTREYGGTGLGLSITKKLLHLLGGTIRVDSCPGDGSTFTVWLPEQMDAAVRERSVARGTVDSDGAVIEDADSC